MPIMLQNNEFDRQRKYFEDSLLKYCNEHDPGFYAWLDAMDHSKDPVLKELNDGDSTLNHLKNTKNEFGVTLDTCIYDLYTSYVDKTIEALKEENKELFSVLENIAPGFEVNYFENTEYEDPHFEVLLDDKTKIKIYTALDTPDDVNDAFVKGVSGTEYEEVVTDTVDRINAFSRGGVLE